MSTHFLPIYSPPCPQLSTFRHPQPPVQTSFMDAHKQAYFNLDDLKGLGLFLLQRRRERLLIRSFICG